MFTYRDLQTSLQMARIQDERLQVALGMDLMREISGQYFFESIVKGISLAPLAIVLFLKIS